MAATLEQVRVPAVCVDFTLCDAVRRLLTHVALSVFKPDGTIPSGKTLPDQEAAFKKLAWEASEVSKLKKWQDRRHKQLTTADPTAPNEVCTRATRMRSVLGDITHSVCTAGVAECRAHQQSA
jgi:hypothetical protein